MKSSTGQEELMVLHKVNISVRDLSGKVKRAKIPWIIVNGSHSGWSKTF